MSREVRRVPLDWKHPTEHNPYWCEQQTQRLWRGDPESRLHAPEVRFVGLMDDYPEAAERRREDVRQVRERDGHKWEFGVEYHLTGFKGRRDDEPTVHPFYTWTEDGQTEIAVDVRDEDHLQELLTAEVESEKPDPADYMPVWDIPKDKLGWCLYQTVSEGAPVTPVFSTAEELIEHLSTVGQDWDQQPMRREAAERLVSDGGSMGSMVLVGGQLFRSDTDADKIAAALDGAS